MNANRSRSATGGVFLLALALFILLYLWANFFNRQAFNLDMYSDAQVAKLMWEQKTLFPENWVFGNQYYVVASPVLAAIFYGICKDSIMAMGLASTTMMFIELALFAWLIEPYASKKSARAGLFAFGGAAIVGTSVCSYNQGFQLLYTMASYYACYVIGILLVLGIYMRYKDALHVSRAMVAVAVLISFGLGMQSVRETLILIIPLLITELLLSLRHASGKKRNFRRSLFAASVSAANVAGLLLVRSLPITSNKSISGFDIPSSLPQLISNAVSSFNEFIFLTGIPYLAQSIKRIPLLLVAIVICAVSFFALVRAVLSLFKGKLNSLGFIILFLALSLCSVFTVGCFLGFKLRSIYYFVWFIMAALSFVYAIESTSNELIKSLVMLALLGCGAVNLFYNAYPDLTQYKKQKELFYTAAQKLEAQGIDCTYVEFTTYGSSAVAACSHDKIDSAIVRLAYDQEKGYCFEAYPHLVDMSLFDVKRKENAVLILTDVYSMSSSFSTLANYPGSKEALMEKLELMSIESNEQLSLYIYRLREPSVIAP